MAPRPRLPAESGWPPHQCPPPQPQARGPRGARGPAGGTCSVCSAPASPAPLRLLLQPLPPPPRAVAAPSSFPAANFLPGERRRAEGRRRGPGARPAPPREGGCASRAPAKGGAGAEACARAGAPGRAEIVPPSPPAYTHLGVTHPTSRTPLPWELGTPCSPFLCPSTFREVEPNASRRCRAPGAGRQQAGDEALASAFPLGLQLSPSPTLPSLARDILLPSAQE